MKIYIPLNQTGMDELDRLQETESENLKIVTFSSEDYKYLNEVRYFDFLNVECHCLIDLYEEEEIQNGYLHKAKELTELLIKQSTDERFISLANQLIECFQLAIDSSTFVLIYCYG